MGGQHRKNLTDAERGVLDLLKNEPLTIKQLSRRRKTSRQATSKLVNSMMKKGFVRHIGTLVVAYTYGGWGMPENEAINYKGKSEIHPIRLHGEAYRIGVLRSSPDWDKVRVSTSIIFQGNRVVAYRDCLMVFSLQSFEGATPDECDASATRYWLGYFHSLERRYGITILRERSESIRRVRAHYAETKNELAQDLRRNGETKVRVFGSRDGKEWLLFDDSLKLDEAETTHNATPKDGRTAKEDMAEVVQPFFNDLRDHKTEIPLLSQQAGTQAHHERMMVQIVKALEQQVLINAQNQLKPNQDEEPPQGTKDSPLKRPDYMG